MSSNYIYKHIFIYLFKQVCIYIELKIGTHDNLGFKNMVKIFFCPSPNGFPLVGTYFFLGSCKKNLGGGGNFFFRWVPSYSSKLKTLEVWKRSDENWSSQKIRILIPGYMIYSILSPNRQTFELTWKTRENTSLIPD